MNKKKCLPCLLHGGELDKYEISGLANLLSDFLDNAVVGAYSKKKRDKLYALYNKLEAASK
jgi:hypothetical protein